MSDPIQTATHWHGGQWTALYRLSSNGRVLDREHRNDCFAEAQDCLTALQDRPQVFRDPEKEKENLTDLLDWLEDQPLD